MVGRAVRRVEPPAVIGTLLAGPLPPRDLWAVLGNDGTLRWKMSLARAVAELREDMVPLYWDPDAGERGLWVMATDRDTAHRYGEWVAKRELTHVMHAVAKA